MKQEIYNEYSFEKDGNRLFGIDKVTGEHEEISELFPISEWDSKEAFAFADVKGYEPMLAKELETEEKQDECLDSDHYFIEEKFDGTRAIVQFFRQPTVDGEYDVGYARVFSRRISAKTGFYVENTDSVPQIRDIDRPEMDGTVLDGEMFINGRPFKDVSSTLNCLFDKAIARQLELGWISLHAFDIIKYKGIDLRRMPLHRRKHYLHRAIEEIGSKYIEEVPCYLCGERMTHVDTGKPVQFYEVYNAYIHRQPTDRTFAEYRRTMEEHSGSYRSVLDDIDSKHGIRPRSYYEMIVSLGGEGVIVKPLDGKYRHKRGWEYSKIKKFLSREVIVMGFTEPTREYDGKYPNDRWSYWVDQNDERLSVEEAERSSAKALKQSGYVPVNRFYYNRQVGNIRYGVVITAEEIQSLPNGKKFNIEEWELDGQSVSVVEVGDCSGFDDDTRAAFSKDPSSYEGSVIEVKANELFKDTGKFRHPRYMRMRFDKSPLSCTWKEHIQ